MSHPFRAFVVPLPAGVQFSAMEAQRHHLGAATLSCDDGRRFLLLQPGEASSSDDVAAVVAVRGLAEPHVLDGYYLELFGWCAIPGIELDFIAELAAHRDDLPVHCRTVAQLAEHVRRPALPAWRRPRAELRWHSTPMYLVCEHIADLSQERLLAWLELRLEPLTPSQVALPVVVRVLGQLGQDFEDAVQLHACARTVYARYCAAHGADDVEGDPELQMLAATREGLCGHEVAACCSRPLLVPMPPMTLPQHPEVERDRSKAREEAQGLTSRLLWRRHAEQYDPASYDRWLQMDRQCCTLKPAPGTPCQQCQEWLAHYERLQELRIERPNWQALQDELDELDAVLQAPALREAAFRCDACGKLASSGRCSEALRL